jgi:hypothetical protein
MPVDGQPLYMSARLDCLTYRHQFHVEPVYLGIEALPLQGCKSALCPGSAANGGSDGFALTFHPPTTNVEMPGLFCDDADNNFQSGVSMLATS